MTAQFSDLPVELRLQIYELSLDRKPRVVEIDIRDNGRVFSKTRPSALLHVNRESRNFALRFYRPWLPQFKGTKDYEPWASIAGQGRLHTSSLINVFLNLELDTLLAPRRWLWRYVRGPIEQYYLRSLAIKMDGWICFPDARIALGRIKNLKTLRIFDDKRDYETIKYKAMRIREVLGRNEAQDKKKPKMRVPNYTAPEVICQRVTAETPNFGGTWTTYKYPKGYKSRIRELHTPFPPTAEELQKFHEQTAKLLKRKAKLEANAAAGRATKRICKTGVKATVQSTIVFNPEVTGRSIVESDGRIFRPEHSIVRCKNSRPRKGKYEQGSSSPVFSSTKELSVRFVLERFVAERPTEDGPEILVQWEGHPDESDWTWEPESTLREDAPEMVEAWKLKRGTDEAMKEVELYKVEAILGKKRVKGLIFYLVRWEGYPLAKDATWEPGERLRSDVPRLVDLFEQKRKG